MKYSVLLLRPDTIADEFGKDTFLAWVEADTIADAQMRGQIAANDADDAEGDEQDYHVLFVTPGHLDDLKE